MVELVDPDEIESIVGYNRDYFWHWGRAVSSEETFYILHSQTCLNTGQDLRECMYSVSLDRYGIVADLWNGFMDTPQRLAMLAGRLIPLDSIKKWARDDKYRAVIEHIIENR